MCPSKATRSDTKSGRFYDIDGESYPSVTQALGIIAKPALINWAASQEREFVIQVATDLYLELPPEPRMSRPGYTNTLQKRLGHERAHQKQLAKAGEIGTQVHALIEWNLRRQLGQIPGPEPAVVPAALHAFGAFQRWADEHDLQPELIEQTVWSKMHGYAGTLDLVAKVGGRRTCVDFKTGKAIYAEAHLQNVAYQYALEEMGHGTVEGGLILRLPKVETDPAFEVGEVPPRDELFSTFLAVLEVWKWWYTEDQKRLAAWKRQKAAEKAVTA